MFVYSDAVAILPSMTFSAVCCGVSLRFIGWSWDLLDLLLQKPLYAWKRRQLRWLRNGQGRNPVRSDVEACTVRLLHNMQVVNNRWAALKHVLPPEDDDAEDQFFNDAQQDFVPVQADDLRQPSSSAVRPAVASNDSQLLLCDLGAQLDLVTYTPTSHMINRCRREVSFINGHTRHSLKCGVLLAMLSHGPKQGIPGTCLLRLWIACGDTSTACSGLEREKPASLNCSVISMLPLGLTL